MFWKSQVAKSLRTSHFIRYPGTWYATSTNDFSAAQRFVLLRFKCRYLKSRVTCQFSLLTYKDPFRTYFTRTLLIATMNDRNEDPEKEDQYPQGHGIEPAPLNSSRSNANLTYKARAKLEGMK